MSNILVKIPTRSRPSQFFRTFNSFVDNQSNDNSIHYLISLDDDDESMMSEGTLAALDDYAICQDARLSYHIGPRVGKIGSVNRDMMFAPPGWDIVMQPADDWMCLVEGWDKRVVEEMEAFPDGDGVVWFFDGHNHDINTLCIMGRKYYERFGYIYYPEYRTFWPDVEFTEVADMLDRQVFCREVLFEHQHPDWTHSNGYTGEKLGYDKLYLENDKQEDRDFDEELFKLRKAKNFGLVRTHSGWDTK